MQFSLVTLHVKDMQKAVVFYNTLLEMPIVRKLPMAQDKEILFLGKENTVQLELIPSDEAISYSGFSIGFEVEDLLAIKERLINHGYNFKKEFSPAPTTTLCFLDGPNGEEIELISYQ